MLQSTDPGRQKEQGWFNGRCTVPYFKGEVEQINGYCEQWEMETGIIMWGGGDGERIYSAK